MPRLPHRPAELRGSVFRGSRAVRAGHLTRHQLRSSAWRRLFPDVYACASLPVTHGLRAEAAAVLLPGGVACGRTAAVLWGVELADADDDVEFTVPAHAGATALPGLRVNRRALLEHEVGARRGIRVTSALRTALDLSRIRPLDEAVVALDQFLAPGLVFLDDVHAAAQDLTGRDCRHIRTVVALADGLAESPQETRLRLLLHRSTLPRPVAQHRVRDGEHPVARVDFAWPDLRVALEYDGAWHGEPGQFGRDRRRLNRLTAAGWLVVFVTAADLRRPDLLLARIERVLASRSALSR